jgi:hypothetical protein
MVGKNAMADEPTSASKPKVELRDIEYLKFEQASAAKPIQQ